jgi:hypothetical protein
MDGFALASRISSCAEETIVYKDIPTFLIGPYFPCETLSVSEFIAFKLPSLQTHIKNPTSRLSNKQPTMEILSKDGIRLINHPSQPDMKRLIAEFDPDDETPSISVEISSCYVPIIILKIWKAHFRLWDLQNLWKDSLRRAESLITRCPSQRHAMKAAQDRLTSCRWNEEIQGFSGMGRSAIGVLIRYLSISCLVTTDIIHHIEILQGDLETARPKVRLMSPIEIQYLVGCVSQGKRGLATYKHLHTYKGLCHLGNELVSGAATHIGGVLLVNQNHWISFIINPENSTVRLADSLHIAQTSLSRAMVEAMEIIQWWLNVSYLGSNKPVISFKPVSLPTAYQNDIMSCGFFALNSLAHHLLPTQYVLHKGSDSTKL